MPPDPIALARLIYMLITLFAMSFALQTSLHVPKASRSIPSYKFTIQAL